MLPVKTVTLGAHFNHNMITSSRVIARLGPLPIPRHINTAISVRHSAFNRSCAPPPLRTFSISKARTMSTTKDVSLQTDIGKMKTEPDGSFKRKDASFRNVIEKGGKFEPEKGVYNHCSCSFTFLCITSNADRYHLYVSYACREFDLLFLLRQRSNKSHHIAWATRTLIFRKLKGLDDLICEITSLVVALVHY